MIVVKTFVKQSVNRIGCTAWHRRSQGARRVHGSPNVQI